MNFDRRMVNSFSAISSLFHRLEKKPNSCAKKSSIFIRLRNRYLYKSKDINFTACSHIKAKILSWSHHKQA